MGSLDKRDHYHLYFTDGGSTGQRDVQGPAAGITITGRTTGQVSQDPNVCDAFTGGLIN